MQHTATINNQAAGIFNATGAGQLYSTGSYYVGDGDGTNGSDWVYDLSSLSFNNAGTLVKSGSATTTTFGLGQDSRDGIAFNNSGSVQVTGGTLALDWGGGGAGTFSTSAGASVQFAGGRYVGSGAASLGGAGTYAVSGGYTTGVAVSTQSLSVSGGRIETTSGTVQNLTVTGGEMYGPITVQTLTVSGGYFSGYGGSTMTLVGTGVWSGGWLNSGSLTVTAAAALSIGGSVGIQNGVLANSGIVTWSAGSISMQNTATINNQAGATFNATGGGQLYSTGSYYVGEGDGTNGSDWVYDLSSLSFNNAGTLVKSGSATTTTFGLGQDGRDGVAFNNSGSVQVTGGTLALDWGGGGAGTFSTSAGASVQFAGGRYVGSGAASMGGAGTYAVSGGYASGLAAAIQNLSVWGGRIDMTSGTVQSWSESGGEAYGPVTAQALNVAGGNFSGLGGTLTLAGSGTWNGGWLNAGAVTVAAGATLAIGANVGISSGTLNNSGTVNWSAGNISMRLTATINNQATATFNATGGGQLYSTGSYYVGEGDGTNGSDWVYDLSSLSFNNAGTLVKSGSATTTTFGLGQDSRDGIAFNNSGSVQVTGGTLALDWGGGGAGTFSTSAGASVQFAGGRYVGSGAASLGGAGTYAVSGGYTTGVAVSTQSLSVSGGRIETTSGTVQNLTVTGGEMYGPITVQTLTVSGGYFSGYGGSTMTLAGTGVWSGGWLNYGSLTVSAPAALSIGSSVGIQNGVLANSGTVTWSAGSISMQHTATINNQSAATFNATGGGQLYSTGSYYVGDGDGTNGSDWVYDLSSLSFNNAGTLVKSGSAATTFGLGQDSRNGVAFNNSGSVQATGGTLALDWGGGGGGSFTTSAGSYVALNGGTYHLQSGALIGPGTFDVNGARLEQDGATSISGSVYAASGGMVSLQSGTLSLTGAVEVTSSSQFSVDGPPSQDRRSVSPAPK